ncbi:phosphopantetheine-binding protein [Ensifer aridi]|uniref:phosphopantetheine-binding protein n=1 Tax=Ensifer aridi TaxID=1708715 RepID=UPI003B839EBC
MEGTGVSDQLVEEVIATIRKRAGAATSADCEEITVATELTSLGLDSLDLADLLWDLEEANNVEIHMNITDAWSNLHTVGDLVESLRTLMAKVS